MKGSMWDFSFYNSYFEGLMLIYVCYYGNECM